MPQRRRKKATGLAASLAEGGDHLGGQLLGDQVPGSGDQRRQALRRHQGRDHSPGLGPGAADQPGLRVEVPVLPSRLPEGGLVGEDRLGGERVALAVKRSEPLGRDPLDMDLAQGARRDGRDDDLGLEALPGRRWSRRSPRCRPGSASPGSRSGPGARAPPPSAGRPSPSPRRPARPPRSRSCRSRRRPPRPPFAAPRAARSARPTPRRAPGRRGRGRGRRYGSRRRRASTRRSRGGRAAPRRGVTRDRRDRPSSPGERTPSRPRRSWPGPRRSSRGGRRRRSAPRRARRSPRRHRRRRRARASAPAPRPGPGRRIDAGR